MFDGLLQFYFLFGMIYNSTKPAVNLRLRAPLQHRLFYHTVAVERFVPDNGEIIERREIDSVEKVIAYNRTIIQILNIQVKIKPKDSVKSEKLLKRPFFDRLEEKELPGDFRSKDHPFGYSWMLLPTPESLMTPEFNLQEGQKWSVKMTGGNFEVHYDLFKVDPQKKIAFINATKGICIHDSEGKKKWNASWIVDTRIGVINYMRIEQNHEFESPGTTIRTVTTKTLRREADDKTIFDYEINGREDEDL